MLQVGDHHLPFLLVNLLVPSGLQHHSTMHWTGPIRSYHSPINSYLAKKEGRRQGEKDYIPWPFNELLTFIILSVLLESTRMTNLRSWCSFNSHRSYDYIFHSKLCKCNLRYIYSFSASKSFFNYFYEILVFSSLWENKHFVFLSHVV